MYKVYPLRNDKSWESLLIHEGNILLMNNSFDEPAAFLASYAEKGLFKKKKKISISSITGLSHLETNAKELKVSYGSSSEKPLFANTEDLEEVAIFLAKETKLIATTEQVGKLKAASAPLIGLAFTVGLAWAVYMDAQIIESGNTVDTSGRRTLFKKMFAWIAEMLGTKGTIAVASVIGLYCVYTAYKKMQHPPNQIVYS